MTMKTFGIEIRRANKISGLYQDVDRTLRGLGPGEVSIEIQTQAIAHSLQQMMKAGNYFDVCTIKTCRDVCQTHISSERMAVYRAAHCIDWNEMTDEFRTMLMAMVLDDFRGVLNPVGEEVEVIHP